MKTRLNRLLSIAATLAAFFVLVPSASAQQTITQTNQVNVNPFVQVPTVTSASAVSDFETGTTAYYYWIVQHQSGGASIPYMTSDQKGPASLANANGKRITVSWAVTPGSTYDVLQTSTPTLASAADCSCAVAIGISSSSFVDVGAARQSYETDQLLGFPFTVNNLNDGGVPTLTFTYNGTVVCTMTPLLVSCGGGGIPSASDGLYYVTTEGSDSNDCRSWGTACLTVQGAETKLAAGTGGDGGVIQAGGGSFTGDFTLSVPTELLCNAQYGTALISDGTASPIASISANGVRITQCAFDGTRTALADIAPTGQFSDIEIDHNDIQNAVTAGILSTVGGTRINLHDNLLTGNGSPGGFGAAGGQIEWLEPATQSDQHVSIINNNMDATDHQDSCILVEANNGASTPASSITGLRIIGNSCSLGGASGYATQGILVSADTGSGVNTNISGAVVKGNTIFSATAGAVVPVTMTSPNGGEMNPAGTNTGTMTVTAAADINIGDTGVVVVQVTQNTGTPIHVSSITDSLGNTWTVRAQQDFSAFNGTGDPWTLVAATAPMGTHVAPTATFTITVNLTGSAFQFFAAFGDATGVGSFVSAVSGGWDGTSGTFLQTYTGGAVTGPGVVISAATSRETITFNPSGPDAGIFIGNSGGNNWQGWVVAVPSGSSSPSWSQSAADAWAAINLLFTAKTGPTEAVAVELNGNVQGASVTGNTSNNLAGALLTGTVADASIVGNSFTGAGATSGGAGVTITSASNNLVDANTLADYDGSGAGAIGIDITNSGATSNCFGINVFDNVTTPVSDSGTTTGCPNSGGAGGGIGVQSTCTLSANVPVTASTLTTVLNCSVTMPAAGGPWHVYGAYNIYVNASNSISDTYITDGTNIFASNENEASGGFFISNNGSAYSPVTYNDGANVTFTIKIECGSNSTVAAAPTQVGQNSWLNIVVTK